MTPIRPSPPRTPIPPRPLSVPPQPITLPMTPVASAASPPMELVASSPPLSRDWYVYQHDDLAAVGDEQRPEHQPRAGSVCMYLAMMPSITSSAPPASRSGARSAR